jgi:peptidoglycan-N-acetylmuramic acid deacetylase
MHHLFCGQGCAELYREKLNGSIDLPQQLDDFDRNVAEDVREATESISDTVHERFEQLENSLDHALTALATMVEGSAVAAQTDLQKAQEEIIDGLETIERRNVERQTALQDKQEELRQLAGVIRGSIMELKERVDNVSAQESELYDRLELCDEKNIRRMEEGEEKFSRWFEEQAEAGTNFQVEFSHFRKNELPKLLDGVDRNVRESQALRLADVEKRIANELARLRSDLERSNQGIHEKVSVELKRLLDDVAALSVAHKGNWNDVVHSAKSGAQTLSSEMKKEVFRNLSEEVQKMAQQQSRAMGIAIDDIHNTLKKKAGGRETSWHKWTLASAMAAGICGLILWNQSSVTRLQGRIENQESSLKQWLDIRLLSFAPKASMDPIDSILPVSAVTRGNTSRKEMAFTFDAGSNAAAAAEILDALKTANIHATMFLTGQFIAENPEVVKRIAEEGHEAGNHLLEHNHLVDPKLRNSVLTKAALMAQLQEVERRYESLTGHLMTHLWRAPYGEINAEIVNWANSMGYTHVGWTRSGRKSLDTLDWVSDRKSSLYRSADKVAEQILTFEATDSNRLNGAIVLMHLGTERTSDFPHKKLPYLFNEIQKTGYKAVTVSQLLRTETALK